MILKLLNQFTLRNLFSPLNEWNERFFIIWYRLLFSRYVIIYAQLRKMFALDSIQHYNRGTFYKKKKPKTKKKLKKTKVKWYKFYMKYTSFWINLFIFTLVAICCWCAVGQWFATRKQFDVPTTILWYD